MTITKIEAWVTFFPFRENLTHDKYEKNIFKLKLTLQLLKDITYIVILKQSHSARHKQKYDLY